MIVSRVKVIFLAVFLFCVAAPALSLAQDFPQDTSQNDQQKATPSAGPVRLSPPKALKPSLPAATVPETSHEISKTTALPTVKKIPANTLAPVTVGEQVEVNSLQAIDIDAAGTLSAGQGGFGADMWDGTSRKIVAGLLPRLPVDAASLAMRDLMHRLLLSVARPPEGKGTSGRLIALRVKLLANMGDIIGVSQLLNATPGRNQNEKLLRLEADMRFLSNDNARACSLTARQVNETNNAYWQKAFIFCQALAGEKEKASLGVALLRELGDEDTVYLKLIETLINNDSVTIESLPNPLPLHLAMARAAKVSMPADVISSNNPSVLSTIAVSPNVSVEVRLDAAERAEASGALPIDALRQLYTSVSFSDEDLANPLSRAEAESGPLSRALLYRTSLIQTVPTAQAEALAKALSLARQGGRYASTARVFMPVIMRIPPSAELAWFAPEAVRALLVGGEEEEAIGAWFALLRGSAMFNKDSAAALKTLMPLAHLAGSPKAEGWSTDNFKDWWESEKNNDGARERAELLYSLFEALGEPVSSREWDALIVSGSERATVAMPHPSLWYRLESMAKETSKINQQGENATDIPTVRHIGETVLLSLLALGEGGPGQANPMVIKRVLTSLRAVGLEKEARALAVEAALAAAL